MTDNHASSSQLGNADLAQQPSAVDNNDILAADEVEVLLHAVNFCTRSDLNASPDFGRWYFGEPCKEL